MAKYETDIIQYLYETYNEQGFEYIDTTALDIIIQEYLETPDNGYFSEEFTYWDEDSTAYLTTVIDSTSPSISVLEWKEDNLENSFNQSLLQNQQISIRDNNSPNYELINFRSALFDFNTADSINYNITPDATADIYIEYGYPTAAKIDGVFFQGGEDGAQAYDSASSDCPGEIVFLAGFISFSNDRQTWKYIKNKGGLVSGDAVGELTTDLDDAKSNPFIFEKCTGFPHNEILNILFDETSIEALYWRFHIVDLKPYLESKGWDSGYTGYTAAMSHLRFQQFKISGEVVIVESLPGNAIQPGGIGGDQIGNGEIEERHLSDFSIAPGKLQGNVTTIHRVSYSVSLPGNNTTSNIASFTLANDDGYFPIVAWIHTSAYVSSPVAGSYQLYLQVREADGSYHNLISYTSLWSALDEKIDVYGESSRDPDTDTSRIIRIRATNGAGEAKTFNIDVKIVGIFAGNQDVNI